MCLHAGLSGKSSSSACFEASTPQDCCSAFSTLLPGLAQASQTPDQGCTDAFAPDAWAVFSNDGQLLLRTLLSCVTSPQVQAAMLYLTTDKDLHVT